MPDSLSFAEFRALFPTAGKSIYLNHAGVSPIARPVAEAVRQVTDALMEGDIVREYMAHLKRQEALREAFGRMMNVATSTLAFTKNTSHGLSLVAQSLPFVPGDNVVVCAGEYPSNVYPWMAQEYRRVSVKLVPPQESGLIPEDHLMNACDGHTRVLAVSWVQWGTGQRMDLDRLGRFCRDRDIYLAVDLVQGLGATRIDLSALPVDFAAAGCHKWLMAPGGLGVLYVRDGLMSRLHPVNVGWNSVEKPTEWDRIHFDELKQTADRMEEGTAGILATAALAKSVELLESVGFDRVHERVLELSAYTASALREHGMTVVTPREDERRSGIVGFRHPSLTNDEVLALLTANGVGAAVRVGYVRFAPHAYSTEEEIARAVAVLPA